jgi:hypothetical protein
VASLLQAVRVCAARPEEAPPAASTGLKWRGRGVGVLQLIGQVPNWVMFSDVDKCLWLNQALSKKLWLYLGAAICTNLKHNLEVRPSQACTTLVFE